MHTQKRWVKYLFLMPAFLLYSSIVIFTLFVSIYYSTLDWDGIMAPVFVGIENYKGIFTDKNSFFIGAIKNSLIFAGAMLFIQLPIAISLAILITHLKRTEKIFRTISFVPVIIMTAVVAQLWLKIYDPNNGLLNEILARLGLSEYQLNWTVDRTTNLASVILPNLWQRMGYYMLIIYAGLKGVSDDVYEAARIAGATKLQEAYYISLPLIAPAIKICVVFMLVGSMKAFDLVYIITGGGPVHSSEVPTITMFTTIFEKYQYGVGSAMATVIIAICFIYTVIVTGIFKKHIDKID